MSYRLPNDTAIKLRKRGLTVVEHAGWQTRGRPASTGSFQPVGVLCHHTATPKDASNDNVVGLLINGRSDLPGPLCHFGLDRDGKVHLIASGRANHAGEAKASGTVAAGDGNVLYIGIEAFNAGPAEDYPEAQYQAYIKLAAALCLDFTHNSEKTVRGHKETSVTGKIDPNFNMDAFRLRVKAEMEKMSAPPKSRGAKVDAAIDNLKAAKGGGKRGQKIKSALNKLLGIKPR